ncbi:MAG: hypothetical protein ABEI75_03265 [Halobaculum sp.]
MANPPQLWTLILSNVFVFLVGGALTVLSYRAQHRLDQDELRYVTLGFGLVTASTVAEVIYAPAIAGVFKISGPRLLTLYTIESLLIGVGLASVFYAIKQY